MSWQKCPVCNGEGTICIPISYAGTNPVCPTCKGARIISEITGFPPVQEINNDKNICDKDKHPFEFDERYI